MPGRLPIDSISSIIDALQERREVLAEEQKRAHSQITHRFLQRLKVEKDIELEKLSRQIEIISTDLEVSERRLRDHGESENAIVPDPDRVKPKEEPLVATGTGSWNEFREMSLTHRKRRLDHHYNDLSAAYIEKRCAVSGSTSFDSFSETLSKFTQYEQLSPQATLQYSNDSFQQSSIVSSIDFDCDADFFAVAGVTKKIKVYDYQRVIQNSVNQIHTPSIQMECSSKISCVAWTKYHKNKLASSDYEGSVTIWDAFNGQTIEKFQEHERRCWSVDFNSVDPKLLASGSDDAKVRLWSLGYSKAITSIEAKANVCCVQFNPHSSFHIAFGSADHCVHYYDIRKADRALQIYKGHKKAVSYVKFLDSTTLVSASTDSQLKLWKCGSGNTSSSPNFSFSGHQNEKNFVGLATDGDYIACGSEDNSLYVYYKGLQKPLIKYRFNVVRSITSESTSRRDEDTPEFLSAVAWRPRSNTLLAANSQGIIKLLALT